MRWYGMTYEYMYIYPQGGKSTMALPDCDLSVVSCELLALLIGPKLGYGSDKIGAR